MVDDGEGSLYENLLKATDNVNDITFCRYASVTKLLKNGVVEVKEENNEVYHTNVPILNGINVNTGTKVVLGFTNNDLYSPFIIGALNSVGSKIDAEIAPYVDDILYDIETKVDISPEAPPLGSACQLTATLLYGNEGYSDKPVSLYDGTQLIDTQNTDENGNVGFTVNPTTTTEYTVKYKDILSKTVTVEVTDALWDDPCLPNARIDEYFNSNAQMYQGEKGMVTRSNNAGGWFKIPYNIASTGDWVASYSLIQASKYPWRLDCLTSNNTPLFTCELRKETAISTEGWFYMSYDGSSETGSTIQLTDGDKILVEKKGNTITVYYKCMPQLSMEVSFDTNYWVGSHCDNNEGQFRTFKDIKLFS